MRSDTILLVCISLSAIQTVFAQLWQFGNDNLRNAVIISRYHGQFSFFQKEQEVQLIVPACHVVTYVRVEVANKISSPTVYYNYKTNIVAIHYNLFQMSSSIYNIIAKAVWQQGCYVRPQAAQYKVNRQGDHIDEAE